jgi:hypothetical protein
MKKLMLLLSLVVVLSAESVCQYTLKEGKKNLDSARLHDDSGNRYIACYYMEIAEYWYIQSSVECEEPILPYAKKFLDLIQKGKRLYGCEK